LATGEKYKKNCETPDIVAQKPRDEICSKSFKNQRKTKKNKEKQRKKIGIIFQNSFESLIHLKK
jgi:hypothetical protein